jgi:hypothetical protein
MNRHIAHASILVTSPDKTATAARRPVRRTRTAASPDCLAPSQAITTLEPVTIATLPDSSSDAPQVPQAYDRIDAAADEMRDFLNMVSPTSDAEALQTLRLAFPTIPLVDRIAAIRDRFFA